MRFNSGAERMQHPQAKLIPLLYWSDYKLFGNELPETLLPLMQAVDTDIINQMQQSLNKSFTAQEKQCAWLAISFLMNPLISGSVTLT